MTSRRKRDRKRKSEANTFHAETHTDEFSNEPLPEIENIENIDPNGDLILIVGADLVGSESSLLCVEKTVAFRVDYKALARTSSVFKAMFDANSDGYRPTASDAGWTEHLPMDSPTGLRFLFLVAHAELSKLPEGHSFQQVYEIILMAEGYDMIPLLKLNARSWYFTGRPESESLRGSSIRRTYFERSPLQITFSDQTSAETLAKACSIGLSLGNRLLVTEVSKHIVYRSQIVDGHLWYEGKDLESFDICIGVQWLEFWKESRRNILGGMIGSLNGFVRQLQGKDPLPSLDRCSCYHDGRNMKGKLCSAFALGSIIQKLVEKGDWPLPDPENMNERTVLSVQALWGSIGMRGTTDAIDPTLTDYYNCDWGAMLKQRINKAVVTPDAFDPDWFQQRAESLGLVDLC